MTTPEVLESGGLCVICAVVGFASGWHERAWRVPVWLLPSAKALLKLDADNALVPHGIGGNARKIIEEFIRVTE